MNTVRLDLLRFLYGDAAAAVDAALADLIARHAEASDAAPALERSRRRWDHRDAILITYADSIRSPGEAPLSVLASVLPTITGSLIPTVHLLPFYPSSSDDGFSVVDYLAVDPDVGTWDDVARLCTRTDLMFDAVINHVSARSAWFQGFLRDDGHRNWFITVPPGTDTSQVVRPRTLPLLTEFVTARGPELVWTTFSPDQIDLNYAHPPVLLAMVDVLLTYVARGATVIRLDAVTYLWKRLGTSCVHLPETHQVIRLFRSVLDEVAPWVTLITETNVPHDENVSYFGDGHGEAQMVYNFALPPLVLHSFGAQDGSALSRWAQTLTTPSQDTGFFNFLASHDGIGVRGAEAILTPAELSALGARAERHSGLVGYRTLADGSSTPYELNINYFDALSDPAAGEPLQVQVARFMTAQAIMLSLPGVPGIYVHSLLGSRGWPEGVALTGANRSINRERLDRDVLLGDIAEATGRRAAVLTGFHRLLGLRRRHRAFDPQAPSRVLGMGPSLFALERGEGDDRVVCLHNVTGVAEPLARAGHDLITDADVTDVPAWGTRWLEVRTGRSSGRGAP